MGLFIIWCGIGALSAFFTGFAFVDKATSNREKVALGYSGIATVGGWVVLAQEIYRLLQRHPSGPYEPGLAVAFSFLWFLVGPLLIRASFNELPPKFAKDLSTTARITHLVFFAVSALWTMFLAALV